MGSELPQSRYTLTCDFLVAGLIPPPQYFVILLECLCFVPGRRFERVVGLQGVLGAIDCTHIAIGAPRELREDYYNHKKFHSINVQMVSVYDEIIFERKK